jgi:hypothetical protein
MRQRRRERRREQASSLGLEIVMDQTSEVKIQAPKHRHEWLGGPWPVVAALVAGWLAGTSCSSTTFVSTWRAPDAGPMQAKGAKVAAVVMMRSDPSRRAAEDRLAHEISLHGAIGVPSYTIIPNIDPTKEGEARSLMQQAQVAAVVVLRPVGVDKTLEVTPAYSDPMYGGYWGGYYGHGWGGAYGGTAYVKTTVYVETLIYSLLQNKLLWGGQSKTVDPQNVDQVVMEIAVAAGDELEHEGMLNP